MTKLDELRDKVARGVWESNPWNENDRWSDLDHVECAELRRNAAAALAVIKSATGLTDEDLEALMVRKAFHDGRIP